MTENGKPIDIAKQRFVVTPQFLWSLAVVIVFLVYISIQATIFLNTIAQYFKDLTSTVRSSVLSYQTQNARYQRYDANATAKLLCYARWEAHHRSMPNVNIATDACERRIAILSDGSVGDVDGFGN